MRVAKKGHALVTTGGAGEAKQKKRTLEVRGSRTREPALAGEQGGEDLEPAGPTSLAEGNDQDGRGNGDQEQRRWQRQMDEHQRHGRLGFFGGWVGII